MVECNILVIFFTLFFLWKFRWSPVQDYALNTTKTILEGIIFMYVLTNTNIVPNFLKLWLLEGKNMVFIYCLFERDTNKQQMFQKFIDPIYIGLD